MTTLNLNIPFLALNTSEEAKVQTLFWETYEEAYLKTPSQNFSASQEEDARSELATVSASLERTKNELLRMKKDRVEFVEEELWKQDEVVFEDRELDSLQREINEKSLYLNGLEQEIQNISQQVFSSSIQDDCVVSYVRNVVSARHQNIFSSQLDIEVVENEAQSIEQQNALQERMQAAFQQAIVFAQSQEQALDEILDKQKELEVFQTLERDIREEKRALFQEKERQDADLEKVVDEHQDRTLQAEYAIKHEEGERYVYMPTWKKLKYDKFSHHAMLWKNGIVNDSTWILERVVGEARNVFRIRNKHRGGWLHETNFHKLVDQGRHYVMVHSNTTKLATVRELYIELKAASCGNNYCEVKFLMHGNHLTVQNYDRDRQKLMSGSVGSQYRPHRWQFIKV